MSLLKKILGKEPSKKRLNGYTGTRSTAEAVRLGTKARVISTKKSWKLAHTHVSPLGIPLPLVPLTDKHAVLLQVKALE